MKYLPLCLLAIMPAVAAPGAGVTPAAAGSFTDPNPQIDRGKFMEETRAAMAMRETRRVTWDAFVRMSRDPATVLLDARNPDKFRLLHIKGAKNLDFTLFTEGELAKVIPTKTTRVLIYYNNNFVDNSPATREAVPAKTVAFSLNLSTFSSLYGYGYRNVYELGPVIDPNTESAHMAGTLIGPDGKIAVPAGK